jgi:membrane protein implicated in regulation of membrane protease activity
MEILIIVALYLGISYLMTKLNFKYTSSFVAFVIGLFLFSTETRMLLFFFLVVISCQIAKNFEKFRIKYEQV